MKKYYVRKIVEIEIAVEVSDDNPASTESEQLRAGLAARGWLKKAVDTGQKLGQAITIVSMFPEDNESNIYAFRVFDVNGKRVKQEW